MFALPMSCGLQRFEIVFLFLLFDLLLLLQARKVWRDRPEISRYNNSYVFWEISRKVQLLNLPHCCWYKWKKLQNYLPKYLHNFFLKKGLYIHNSQWPFLIWYCPKIMRPFKSMKYDWHQTIIHSVYSLSAL